MRTRRRPQLRMQPRRPRGRPKAEDVEALEARLVSVARQAFVLNGYGATSINEIARSARVSKNTLYSRFPSKVALFRNIVARQIAGVDEEVGPTSDESDESLEEKLRTYVSVAMRRSLSKEVLEFNRLILGESYQFPELGEASQARFQTGVQHVAALIEMCAKRDRIPCRDAHGAAEVFLYSLYGWYTAVVVSNRVVTDKEQTAWINLTTRTFVASRSEW